MTYCPRAGCPHPLVRGFGCVAHGVPSEALAPDVAAELHEERATKEPHQKWTGAERARLLELATPERSGTDIAVMLTAEFGTVRTLKSVKHQLERLGVSKPRVRGKKRPARKAPHWANRAPGSRWCEEEDAALEDGEARILQRARSTHAIACRATRIGQPVRSGDGALSVRQVAERWRVRSNTVCDWVHRGLLPAHRNGRLWRIDPGDAERMVPTLKREAARNNGRKGWWQ